MADLKFDSDSIISMCEEASKRIGKVERWMEQNPDKGAIFLETCEKAIDRMIPLSVVIAKCNEILGGPPGSLTVVRRIVKKHVQEKSQR